MTNIYLLSVFVPELLVDVFDRVEVMRSTHSDLAMVLL